jgi:hypothetical protein
MLFWFQRAGTCLGIAAALAGCAGAGQVVPLKLQTLPAVKSVDQSFQNVRVVVEPFEAGADADRLGVRTHLGGGETVFTVQGGNIGSQLAQMVGDHLSRLGFQVWVRKSSAQEVPATPDVVITGQVQQVSASARSRFFSTKMTARVKAVIQAANASDRSTVRLNLDGMRENAVFWFEPAEVQELVNRALAENLDKVLADVKVQDRALQTK